MKSPKLPKHLAGYMKCPFCLEDDFDAYGLKLHLYRSWCDIYSIITEESQIELNNSEEDKC